MLASAYIAAAQAGDEMAGEFSELIRTARELGELDHPLVITAANWRAWLHPRGKDGRFIETFAMVDIFANPHDRMGDHAAPRLRGRITKLTDKFASVSYFDKHGNPLPPDPAHGFPAEIPQDQIRGKISLAPHAIARLDGKRDQSMWANAIANFNQHLREDPPPGKSANVDGPPLELDSQAFAEHETYVNAVLDRAAAGGLTAGSYLRDPSGKWYPEVMDYFQQVANEEVAKVAARGVPKDHQAVMLGGPPASGKTTAVMGRHSFFAAAGLGDPNKWAVIDPDYYKKLLVERGDIPAIDGLAPMETAPLFHALSSEISYRVGQELMSQGYNVVFDMTMRGERDHMTGLTPPEADALELKNAGYKVDGIFLDIPTEVAIERQKLRQLAGLNALRSGENPLGGRVVPPHVTKRGEKKTDSALNFGAMVDNGTFMRWSVVNNATAIPVLSAAGTGAQTFPDPMAALQDPANVPGGAL